MRVVYCEPNESPKMKEIGDDLESMQKTVGGYIEAIYPFEDKVALICNEDGKFNGMGRYDGLGPNRALLLGNGKEVFDIIYGPFFVCGLTEEGFCSIPEELEDKYFELLDCLLIQTDI